MGEFAGVNNTGNNVNAFGSNASAIANTFNNVNLFGESATATANGQTVLSKDGTIMARINTTDLTDNREYDLPDEDGVLALISDIPSPITIDANPTDGSANAVSSNGVFDALALKQDTITNPVTGTGANGQVSFWNGANSQTGDNGLFWDNTNKRLEIFNSSVGVGIAPLIVRNNVPYQSPFTQFIQVWQNSGGGVLASVRADGRIFSSNDVNSNYFVTNIAGTTGSPVFRLGSNGLFFPNSSNLGFVTNSTERMRITDTGNVAIGATTAGARLDVRAQGALSTDIAFRVRNSADTANLLTVNGLGGVEINSTTQGVLFPRMTTTQKNAIVSPASGLVIYDTTLNKLCVRGASAWETITSI
jgi:hypothetical protein